MYGKPPLPPGCVPESNATLIDKYPTSSHIEYPNCTWPNGTESQERVIVFVVGPNHDQYYKEAYNVAPEFRCNFSNTSRFDEKGQPVPIPDEPPQPSLLESGNLIFADCPAVSEAASLTPGQAVGLGVGGATAALLAQL
jgi:hypothetical protein